MSEKFVVETGRACLLAVPNIDTDVIIPQTELATISKSGLADGLFARWRYGTGRELNPDFVLNKPAHRGCRFLIAAANFGCGSSREHAVWALRDFGIRAVISPAFAEIFFRNALRNGVLAATVAPNDYERLAAAAAANDGGLDLIVDLPNQRVVADDVVVPFVIGAEDKRRLLRGTDEIEETLEHLCDIDTFIAADRGRRPWIYETPWSQ